MAISLASLNSTTTSNPPRMIIYGVAGIGKSTFCAAMPNPVFIQTEDGLGGLQVDRFPLAKSYEDVMEALGSLAQEDHQFKTLVLDSLDWLEPLIWNRVARDHNVKSIEDIGYGKGFLFALDHWREYQDAINWLRNEKQMTVIQTAHSQIKRFDSPENDPYDRYEIKLHKTATALVQEHADIVLFANYKTHTTQTDVGFGNKKSRAVGSGERVLYTEERPAFIAKNRFGMPEQVPMNWDDVSQFIPFYQSQTEEG